MSGQKFLTLEQIQLAWGRRPFDQWNTTLVGHLFDALFEERKNKESFDALMMLLKKFHEWRDEQPDEYFPQSGCETMFSKDFFRVLYEYFKAGNPKEEDDTDAKKSFSKFTTDIIEKYGKRRMMTEDEIQALVDCD